MNIVEGMCLKMLEGRKTKGYEELRLVGYKNPVRTTQDTLFLPYRAQPVNAM
jgi:hypothetical protein